MQGVLIKKDSQKEGHGGVWETHIWGSSEDRVKTGRRGAERKTESGQGWGTVQSAGVVKD